MSGGFWRGKNVLVTGAGGFVGSWLAKALAERGARVVCLLYARAGHSNLELIGIDGELVPVQGDLADFDLLDRTVREHAVDSCFHLAAQPIVGIANASPVPTFETNVRGTWNLLEACRVGGTVERVVVASSDKAYGDQVVLPYTEDLPLSGIYPYDASKACQDIVSRSYARSFGLPLAVTRMANIYGGGDLNLSRIVPGTVLSALRGEAPVIRSDGTPVRDYLHVDDAVAAYLRLAESLPDEELRGEAFNFGTNEPVAVVELVERILAAAGTPDLEPTVLSQGKITGEIDRQFLDSGKAKSMLGWEARVGLDEGLQRTVEWYTQRLDRLPAA